MELFQTSPKYLKHEVSFPMVGDVSKGESRRVVGFVMEGMGGRVGKAGGSAAFSGKPPAGML